jgi:hypothetical protein
MNPAITKKRGEHTRPACAVRPPAEHGVPACADACAPLIISIPWLKQQLPNRVKRMSDWTNGRSSVHRSCLIGARWDGLAVTSAPSSNRRRLFGGGPAWQLPRLWHCFCSAASSTWFPPASAFGEIIFRLAGRGTLPTSCFGLVSATRRNPYLRDLVDYPPEMADVH